jgi:hypothetical protein
MTERCRVSLSPNAGHFRSYWELLGRPTSAVVTEDALLLIGANADYATTPIKQIYQCDRVVKGSPPNMEYEAEVDTPMWHILLSFPTERELNTFVSAVWAVVLARFPDRALSRYGQDHGPQKPVGTARSSGGSSGFGCVGMAVLAIVVLVIVAAMWSSLAH